MSQPMWNFTASDGEFACGRNDLRLIWFVAGTRAAPTRRRRGWPGRPGAESCCQTQLDMFEVMDDRRAADLAAPEQITLSTTAWPRRHPRRADVSPTEQIAKSSGQNSGVLRGGGESLRFLRPNSTRAHLL